MCESNEITLLPAFFFRAWSLIGNLFYIMVQPMIYFPIRNRTHGNSAKGMYDLESKLVDAAMHKKITLQNCVSIYKYIVLSTMKWRWLCKNALYLCVRKTLIEGTTEIHDLWRPNICWWLFNCIGAVTTYHLPPFILLSESS